MNAQNIIKLDTKIIWQKQMQENIQTQYQ
jgi:hypothetical protein